MNFNDIYDQVGGVSLEIFEGFSYTKDDSGSKPGSLMNSLEKQPEKNLSPISPHMRKFQENEVKLIKPNEGKENSGEIRTIENLNKHLEKNSNDKFILSN